MPFAAGSSGGTRPPKLSSPVAWRAAGWIDVVGVDDGTGGAGRNRRVRLPSEIDKRRRRAARLSKRCWLVAKGALSSSRADTVFGAVLDDASTNSRNCGGTRVLPVDDKSEVAKI